MIPELLAPAKNLEVALAAVNHGADAVYIGATKFGAREAAGNSLQDLEKAVKYAHKFRAKVFLTLNTILHERELDEARKIAVAAYNMGCDSLIIQDMAFLEMDLPPIALHASTQTHNITPKKVKFLQDVGFRRVVLARELTLNQIAEIRAAATTVELEYFIHGALCVSYSGQCYLSQMLTNRSANRGACAQPCRAAYNLVDSKNNTLLKNAHLLSLKDFNLTKYLQNLAHVGVCSFKIEGRLKDVDYVKNVVGHYRKTLDEVFAGQKKTSSGKIYLGFEPNPEKTFSRGFTNYFVENGKTGFCTLNTAKAVGEPVGVVKLFDSQSITVDTNSKAVRFATGDGICYFDKGNVLHGANVNHVEGSRLWLQSMEGVSEGCPLFRNFDIAFQKQLDNPHSAKRLIDVKMQFEATPQSVRITATDEDGIFVSQVFEKQVVKATNEAKILTTIHEQLSKSGNFTFKITDVTVIPSQPSFYTISELNSWRRNVLTKLEEKREKRYMVEKQEITKNTLPYPDLNLNFKSNVLNSLARRFYERHGVQKIALAYEAEKPAGEAELMLTRYCILRELDCCKNDKKAKRLQEPLYLENNGQRLRLSFNCTCCEMAVVG